ncbi:4Fe-4S binding protein [Methanobrevibacter millerae]|nr:4Fe-4S binding protein [Methanobrevibacter millerae]
MKVNDMRIRYHQPIPNFFKIENPINPLNSISDDVLNELNQLINEKDFFNASFSRLSEEFKNEWGIDWDNIIILKYKMSDDILTMEPSREKCVLEDKEFQEFGKKAFEIADYLRQKGFRADLIHPLDDAVSLRAIAMQSNDCIITRSNMCMFKEALNVGFFMIETSIENLPFKSENDMQWVEDFCSACGVCVDRCPENAFDEEGKFQRKLCTAHKEGCSKCVLLCPFYKRGYDKVKKRYERKQGVL